MMKNHNLLHSQLENEEDILEQLCLWEKKGVSLTIERLCEHFDVDKDSMEVYLGNMYKHDYIEEAGKKEELALTAYGMAIGNNYIYRHNSISQMLQMIGVQEKIADQDACRIEHIVTDESARAICQFVNYENMYYERRIRNSELTDRYEKGQYNFIMQMYSLEQRCPRRLKEEYSRYSREIMLDIGDRSYFELQRHEPMLYKKLWYKGRDMQWTKADMGEHGERIPANAFEFIVKPNDKIIEGNLLIAFMSDRQEEPEIWDCGQLEVEIW